jgi:hypothetical protein
MLLANSTVPNRFRLRAAVAGPWLVAGDNDSVTDGASAFPSAFCFRRVRPSGLAAWQSLAPVEQVERLRALVERVDYDGRDHQVMITLRRSASPAQTGAGTPLPTEDRP